jgi:hypothetical protein
MWDEGAGRGEWKKCVRAGWDFCTHTQTYTQAHLLYHEQNRLLRLRQLGQGLLQQGIEEEVRGRIAGTRLDIVLRVLGSFGFD